MSKRTASSRGELARLESASADLQAGIARDKLIFIIICSAALIVAAITIVRFSKKNSGPPAVGWQCLECDHQFNTPPTEAQPVYCPQCGGAAANFLYRECPKCAEKNVVGRVRHPQQGDQAAAGAETQYRIKQSDGTYTWTDWVSVFSPMAHQRLQPQMMCTKCDANLYGYPAD